MRGFGATFQDCTGHLFENYPYPRRTVAAPLAALDVGDVLVLVAHGGSHFLPF